MFPQRKKSREGNLPALNFYDALPLRNWYKYSANVYSFTLLLVALMAHRNDVLLTTWMIHPLFIEFMHGDYNMGSIGCRLAAAHARA